MKLHINKSLLALVLAGMVGFTCAASAADLDLTGVTNSKAWYASDGSAQGVDGKIIMGDGSLIGVGAANPITVTVTDGIELTTEGTEGAFTTIESYNGNLANIVAKITGTTTELRYTRSAKVMKGWQESDYTGTTNIAADNTTTFDAEGRLSTGGELHAWGANGNTVKLGGNATFSGLTAGQNYTVGQNLYATSNKTLNFNTGNITFNGSVNADDANLTIAGAQSLALGETGSIHIASGRTLTLNSSLNACIADLSKISNEGTLAFGSNAYLILTDMEIGSTFNIGALGSVSSIYTGDRSIVAAYDATSHDVVIQHGTAGNIAAVSNTWKGTTGNSTWSTDFNDRAWQGGVYDSTFFADGDTVTFGNAASKDVTVDGDVSANDMLINASGYTFSSDNGGTITVTGKLETATGADLDVTIATDFVATGVTATGTDNSQGIHQRRGSLTFGDGVTEGVAAVSRLEMGDAQEGSSSLNVKSGYVLKVTGNVFRETGNNTYKDASLLLGEWKIKTTATIDGSLLAKDAILGLGDKGGDLIINADGVVAVKGVKRAISTKPANFKLKMAGDSLLVLGDGGIADVGNNPMTSDLQGGTIGASAASTTINQGLTLNGEVTFDTTTYAFSADGNSVARTTADAKASTIKVTGALAGDGALKVKGDGKLELTHASGAGSRDITVEGATLAAAADVEVGGGKTLTATGGATIEGTGAGGGNVTIAENGTLKLAAVADGTPALTVNGTLTLADGAKIDLSEALGSSFTLTETEITLATATSLVVGAGATVTVSGLDSIDWTGYQWVLTAGGTQLASSTGTASGISLMALDNDLKLTVTEVKTVAPYVTNVGWADGALKLTIEGDTGTAALAVLVSGEMWAQMMQTVTANGGSVSGEGVSISLVNAADAPIDLSGYTSVTFNGYAGEGSGKYAVIFIPEPATATLSLLALAGLAARRRRK